MSTHAACFSSKHYPEHDSVWSYFRLKLTQERSVLLLNTIVFWIVFSSIFV